MKFLKNEKWFVLLDQEEEKDFFYEHTILPEELTTHMRHSGLIANKSRYVREDAYAWLTKLVGNEYDFHLRDNEIIIFDSEQNAIDFMNQWSPELAKNNYKEIYNTTTINNNNVYPYYSDLYYQAMDLSDIQNELHRIFQNSINYTEYKNCIYFNKKEDAALFKLSWSNDINA